MESYAAILENKGYVDFNPVYFGCCQCRAGSTTNFGARSHFLIHYVISGKGILNLDGRNYNVHQKQIFLIPPYVSNHYIADKEEPWAYIWVAFKGNLSKKFSDLPPVSDFYSNLFFEMMDVKNIGNMKEEFLIQKLFELYTILFRDATAVNYVKAVQDHISRNYMHPDISIAQIAESLNVSHPHLSRLFKAKTGVSIQDFLTNTRISRAVQLLRSGESVQSTAYQVGYTDTFNFSKAFKRNTGAPPVSYKSK